MSAYWKVWTHDRRPPIQGGEPAWDGAYPRALPTVRLDRGPATCGRGWNCTRDLATAFRIAGLWPDGRPSLATLVEPGPDVIERGDKCRASALTILRAATDDEVRSAIERLSEPFGRHARRMADEQIAWRAALARAGRDAEAVERNLREALSARGLDEWEPKRCTSAGAAWDAWDAWDAGAAWSAWVAGAQADAWDARAAWAAWATWAAGAAWAAGDAWAAWDARAPWAAGYAGDAWAALTVLYAALEGWIERQPEMLTIGIRDAYANGLAVAVPTGPKQLGWAMAEGTA